MAFFLVQSKSSRNVERRPAAFAQPSYSNHLADFAFRKCLTKPSLYYLASWSSRSAYAFRIIFTSRFYFLRWLQHRSDIIKVWRLSHFFTRGNDSFFYDWIWRRLHFLICIQYLHKRFRVICNFSNCKICQERHKEYNLQSF